MTSTLRLLFTGLIITLLFSTCKKKEGPAASSNLFTIGNIVFASGIFTLFSTDQGATWTSVNEGLDGNQLYNVDTNGSFIYG